MWNAKLNSKIILLFCLVLILGTVFFLPLDLKQKLRFSKIHPTIFVSFVSSYIHKDSSHLVDNLVWFILIYCLIISLEKENKRFFVTSFFGLLFLPSITSYLSVYLVPNLPPSLGFSSIVSFYYGYFLFLCFDYIRKNLYYSKNYQIFWIFLLTTFLIPLYNFKKFNLFFLNLLIICLLILCSKQELIKISKAYNLKVKSKEKLRDKILFLFSSWGGFLSFSLIFLTALLPETIISGNSIINILAHFLGYFFGVFFLIFYDIFWTKYQKS